MYDHGQVTYYFHFHVFSTSRDPVDRYYSAYYYYRPKSKGLGTPEEFHQQAVSDVADWNKCLEALPERKCLQNYVPQQLVKGLYAAFLPAWLEVGPRDRFLIMRTEDYKAAEMEHIAAAVKFLGGDRSESRISLG